MTSLPANLPNGLTNLNCSDNSLTSLPTLPSTLQQLRCDFNRLTSLPALPNSLQLLDGNNNQLTNLPTLPNSLQTLDCHNNQLANLPALPNSLQYLDCFNNDLTTLPTLPAGLQRLLCKANQLTSLPTLPNTLNDVLCNDNQLTTLPTLPASLQALRCSGNLITCLPTLPNTLTVLQVDDNLVSCLPNYPPNFVVRNGSFNVISLPLCSPSIVTHPSVSSPICLGNSLTLTAKATGTGTITITVKWQRNGVDIAGTSAAYTSNTNVVYTFTPALTDNGASYRAVFTGSCASLTATNAATIAVSNIVLSTPSVSNVLCNGGNTGIISVVATGNAPFTYNWSNSGTTATLNNLISGTYSVTVTNANGCIKTASATVSEPTALVLSTPSVTNNICNGGNTGSASVTASGGTSPYTYAWSNGATTANATGLRAGTYTLTVKDANGCTKTTSVRRYTKNKIPVLLGKIL